MSVRKAHNSGRNHLRNVVDYYQREREPPTPPTHPITHPKLSLHQKPRTVSSVMTNPPFSTGAQKSATKKPNPSSTPSPPPTPPRANPAPTPCSPTRRGGQARLFRRCRLLALEVRYPLKHPASPPHPTPPHRRPRTSSPSRQD